MSLYIPLLKSSLKKDAGKWQRVLNYAGTTDYIDYRSPNYERIHFRVDNMFFGNAVFVDNEYVGSFFVFPFSPLYFQIMKMKQLVHKSEVV